GVPVKAQDSKAHSVEAVADLADSADLLVLSPQTQRSLLACLRGQPVLRLMRRCACPVLVTRTEADAAYERVLVAVNFGPGSEPLVQLACALDDRAVIELFHAVSRRGEAKLRSAEVSERAVSIYR